MSYPIPYDQYQKNLKEGKFIGLRCRECGSVTFPPMAVCRQCNSTSLAPQELKGTGTLRTFTVIRVAPEGRIAPYIVAMAELDEGAFAVGNLEGMDPNHATMDFIGKKVRLGSRLVTGDTYSGGDTYTLTFSLENHQT